MSFKNDELMKYLNAKYNNGSISNTLFHFVSMDGQRGRFKPDNLSSDILKSILENKRINLTKHARKFDFSNQKPSMFIQTSVPMVCFTETPRTYIGSHMAMFGNFGVGFKLDWGRKIGAQNVVYHDEKNSNNFMKTMNEVFMCLQNNNLSNFDWTTSLAGVTEPIENRSEREWRFIGKTDIEGEMKKRMQVMLNNPTEKRADLLKEIEFRPFSPKYIDFNENDVELIVCPKEYAERFEDVILAQNYPNEVKVIESEELTKLSSEEGL